MCWRPSKSDFIEPTKLQTELQKIEIVSGAVFLLALFHPTSRPT